MKIEIQFLGSWATWREGYKTLADAQTDLAYWRNRCSWPLRLGKE